MEIVESTTGVSQKQMNEALTVATTSAEGSNVNVSVGGNSTAAAAATANLTAETRTKDINTTKTITASTAGSTDILLQKDIDMDIEEILTKSTLKADFTKVDDKTHQSTVKLMSTNTATIPIQLDDDIPIISLSDSEDVVIQPTTTSQKSSRKRNSVGGAATAEEDQQFRLKRRKIKVAGAPKMPLTGYVRYMNDRRELLRKELPTKTAIEHTKIIGEEWQKMSEDKKAPYMKAAEVDKQRYLAELHTFLKERPDVLACELAKDKQAKKLEHGKTVLKEKSQSVGNIKSPNKDSNASTTTNKAEKSRRSADKDNSSSSPPPPPPAAPALATAMAQATTTTTIETKPKRKRTPTPPKTVDTHAGSSSKTNTSSSYTSANNSSNNTQHSTTSSSNHTTTTATTTSTTNPSNASTLVSATAVSGEIPIFTNEFLEHNKVFDMELRTLRKSKADLEQQNAVLEKHVENMKFGVEKMTNENDELAEKNRLLELYLEKLKTKLAHALSGLAIPTQPNGATTDNIEKYMGDLYKMATTNTHGPASLNKAKDIIRKLDLQINL